MADEELFNNIEKDAITGLETIMPMPQASIDEILSMRQKEEQKLIADELQKTTKATAQAKLAALGLTADDLKALGL